MILTVAAMAVGLLTLSGCVERTPVYESDKEKITEKNAQSSKPQEEPPSASSSTVVKGSDEDASVEAVLEEEQKVETSGLIQTKWRYFFADETYVVGWMHFYKLYNDKGNIVKIDHTGVDVVVKNQISDVVQQGKTDEVAALEAASNSMTAGYATDKVAVYSVCDGILRKRSNWVTSQGDGANDNMGNFAYVETKEPIKFVKYQYDDDMNVTAETQGEAILSLRYLHLMLEEDLNAEFLLPPDSEIKAGQLLGYVGHTGKSSHAHLHFDINTAMTSNGTGLSQDDYLDPVNFFETQLILKPFDSKNAY